MRATPSSRSGGWTTKAKSAALLTTSNLATLADYISTPPPKEVVLPIEAPRLVPENHRIADTSREVQELEKQLSWGVFKIEGAWREYDSDNGEWRQYAGDGKRKLPQGVLRRCSLRLRGRW